MKLNISANGVFIFLIVFISFLVIAHSIQAYFFLAGFIEYIDFLDLDVERNLPTFYSSLTIEFCAILLAIIYWHERKQGNAYSWAWLGLSIIFAFLGLDEATKIHENLGDLIEPMLDAAGALYFPWVLPYGIAVIVIAIIYIPWLLQLPLYTRIHFFISGTLFLSGALGLEILSATFADQYGLDSAQYTWTYTAEETLEMLGIALFIRALIHYLSSHTEEISIVFSAETKQEA